jgi:DNA repair protein RadC
MTLSSNDIETTKRLMEVGKIIGIPLVDHIIFTGMNDVQNYISMKEHGYIP